MPASIASKDYESYAGYSPFTRMEVESTSVVLVPHFDLSLQTVWKARFVLSYHTTEGVPDTVPWAVTVAPQTLVNPQFDLEPHTDFGAGTK